MFKLVHFVPTYLHIDNKLISTHIGTFRIKEDEI